jgi:restriction system protein
MPRRRTSDLEDWINLAARLPWWLALVLALASYWGLHTLAQMPAPTASSVQDMGASISSGMLRGLATIGQYLVPAVLVLGAIASAAATVHRRKLLSESKARAGTADLQEPSWQNFERLVGQAFRERGFQVSEAPPGPDGGVDLTLRKDGELHLVQCKRWRAQKVGVEIVRELYGVMSARGAAGGYVITSGDFTPEARRFAQGRNIELWNGPRLKAAIRGVQAKAPAPAPQGTPAATSTPPSPALACPICGASMVKRTARKGPNAGQAFWGCTRFPTCRGTRPMPAQ